MSILCLCIRSQLHEFMCGGCVVLFSSNVKRRESASEYHSCVWIGVRLGRWERCLVQERLDVEWRHSVDRCDCWTGSMTMKQIHSVCVSVFGGDGECGCPTLVLRVQVENLDESAKSNHAFQRPVVFYFRKTEKKSISG